MRHFLRDDDLSPSEQAEVLELATAFKVDRHHARPLEGPRSVAVMFDKSSTRTRVSFMVGIADLGGQPVVLDRVNTQQNRGESVADTARVLDRMVEAVIWRTFAHGNLVEMAEAGSVPVVNALCDDFHPCQVLADLLTIREHKRRLAGVRVAFVGDGGGNMAHSYALGCANAGMHVRIGCPAEHSPRADVLADAEALASAAGGSVQVCRSPSDVLHGADVVATDAWVSMGQEGERDERRTVFARYSVTTEAMAYAASDAIVLHCLPAYRGLEIAAEVLDGPQSVVWDQAENRLHAQKALLSWLLQKKSGGPR